MRIWHRFTAFVPLLLAITMVTEARAQSMMGVPSYGTPAFMADGNSPGPNSYGPMAYGPPSYQGMPGQSFQSHPAISPFDNALEQHFSSDGIWFKKLLGVAGARNSYFFNMDFVRTKSRGLTGGFTNENAATFTQLETTDGTGGTFPDSLSLNNFNPATATAIPRVKGNGIKLSGGIKNPLGWGWGWDVLWNANSTSTYNARTHYEQMRLKTIDSLMLEAASGDGLITTGFADFNEKQFAIDNILRVEPITAGLALTFPILGDADEILDRVLMNLHSISLLNGVTADVGGVAQRFDLEFVLQHKLQSFEAGTYFSWTPIYESDSLTVSPLVGGRFMRVDEGFSFIGADSGLLYTANIPDGIDDDDDFVVDNVGETGTATFTEGNPSRQSYVLSMMDTYIQSSLVGPEVGLEYTFGDKDSLSFTGSTRFGAFFNTETARLRGDNILDTQSSIPNPDPTGTDILEDGFDTTLVNGVSQGTQPNNMGSNAFSDGKNSTHVSPVFRQSFTAEYPIFSKVPVLRDCWQLEGAKFRAGWTYLWVGEMADPQQSIVKVSNPRLNIFPHLDIKRSSYFQNQFNFGINWEF